MEANANDQDFLLAEWFQSWADTGLESGIFAKPSRLLTPALGAKLEAARFAYSQTRAPVSDAAPLTRAPVTEAPAAPIAADSSTETASPGTAPPADGPLALDVLFVLENPLHEQTHALLSRMVTAMGVAPGRVGVTLASRVGQALPLTTALSQASGLPCTARFAVILGSASAGRLGAAWQKGLWSEIPEFGAATPAIFTHTLDELLKQPALKRAVWEDLQQVMHKLSAV